MFINLHTHHAPVENEKAIISHWENFAAITNTGYHSIGIHPWHIFNFFDKQIEELTVFSSQPNVIAIGEAGLDKMCNTDWQLQQKIFIQQILLANQLQKTLIIHCVKAWDEVLYFLKQEKVQVPVIFHGYNKNKELAKQIVDSGFYLSFGKALHESRLQEILITIPHNRFFLETDDADIKIEEVYNYAAKALSIEVNALSLQIQKNTKTVFGNSFI